MNLKAIASDLCPPLVKRAVRRLVRPGSQLRWVGDFPDWRSASTAAGGYDQAGILACVERAIGEVLAGRAAYERDGVLFHDREARWQVLSACLLAQRAGGALRVLDFGGSLGSLWLQHRRFLEPADVSWRIVEQPAFVEAGRRIFPSGPLSFHGTPAEACADGPPSLAIISSVLQYLADPDGHLRRIADLGPEYILIDRNLVHDDPRDRITVQHVPPSIYSASYPCWIFARDRIPAIIADSYEIIGEYACEERAPGNRLPFLGWLLRRREAISRIPGPVPPRTAG